MKPIRTALAAGLALAPLASFADWYATRSDLFGFTEIRRYSNSGTYLGSFGTGGMTYAIGIVVAPDGRLLVADYYEGTVHTFDSEGVQGPDLVTNLEQPLGLLIDSAGTLLVGEETTGYIRRYALDGTQLADFAYHGWQRQNQMAMDAAGNVYSCTHFEDEIRMYAPDGTYLGVFADSASAGLQSPAGIAFDADGNMIVTETQHNNIKVLDASGALVSTTDIFPNVEPEWVTLLDDGTMLVPCYSSGNIARFDLSGNYLGDFDSGAANAYEIVRGPDNLAPDSFQVTFGRRDAGNVGSLAGDDGDVLRVCRFIVPNTLVAPVDVTVRAAAQSATARSVRAYGRSRMATSGAFREEVDVLDANGAAAGSSSRTVTTTEAGFSALAMAGGPSLIDASGNVRARVRVRKTGPSAGAQWCYELDQLRLVVTP